jgi:hypothetical protein
MTNILHQLRVIARWWRSLPTMFKKWARQREYRKDRRANKRLQRQTRIPATPKSQFIDHGKQQSDQYMDSLRR